MIEDRNKPKTVTNHKSCECKCRFDTKDVIQINGGIATKCQCECKKIMYVKKIMSGILVHVFVKMKNIQQVLWMIHPLFMVKYRCGYKINSEG